MIQSCWLWRFVTLARTFFAASIYNSGGGTNDLSARGRITRRWAIINLLRPMKGINWLLVDRGTVTVRSTVPMIYNIMIRVRPMHTQHWYTPVYVLFSWLQVARTDQRESSVEIAILKCTWHVIRGFRYRKHVYSGYKDTRKRVFQ